MIDRGRYRTPEDSIAMLVLTRATYKCLACGGRFYRSAFERSCTCPSCGCTRVVKADSDKGEDA